MSSTHLQASVSALSTQLRSGGDWGRLEPGTASAIAAADAALSLPASLRCFYEEANPRDVELPWIVEWLALYSVDQLFECQEGYRYAVGTPAQTESSWKAEWIVIGDASGDPVIVDRRSVDAPVLMAAHGLGAWTPKRVSASLADFLRLVAGWLIVWRAHGGDVRDTDGVLREKVFVELATSAAAHLADADRNNFMSFVG